MKVAISGASGMVGRTLAAKLRDRGDSVIDLVRREAFGPNEARWDPLGNMVDMKALEGCDAVVHLAGESIAEGRWTESKKRAIHQSRAAGTETLATALAAMDQKPGVLVSASAIGFYGDRGDEVMTEESTAGELFLSQVCSDWEAAAAPAAAAGIRVVHPRIGVVLSTEGGALAKMLMPFKMGAGGRIGNGRQWMSWIALHDLVSVLVHLIDTDSLRGPVNAVAPNPVTNQEFTKTLGKALSRPTIFPMPAFAAKLAFGEMADELLLASTRVLPPKLGGSGFAFATPTLTAALAQVLGK